MAQDSMKKVAIIDGCRIPFLKSGTGYKSLMAYDLGRLALKGLLAKTQLDPGQIDHVVLGTVVADVTTSNVAREVVLGAGLKPETTAHTVTMACISSNKAFTDAVDLIRTGEAKVVLAGGTDTVSDFPIRYRKRLRQKLMEMGKYRKIWDYLGFFKGLKGSDLLPEIPNITEFSTGLTMGQSCERIAARVGVSQEEQDQYALSSHARAAKAWADGNLGEEVYGVRVPPDFKTIAEDNGIRKDATMEKLAQLKPAFVKKYGTITAGNASFLTDGASMMLLMAEDVAKSLGYQPKAFVRDYVYTGHDSQDELLLGPAYAIPKLLDKVGLALSDISVFELHEAFAAQVIAALKCLASDTFAKEKLGKSEKVGEIPMDRLNAWGGSLSLGHPFGATGTRLLTTATNRLLKENGQFALSASCAAGAMASAILLERA